MRIDLDKSFIVVKICLGFGKLVGFLHIIFESDVTKIFLVEKFVNLFRNVERFVKVVSHVLHKNSILSKGKVCEVLKFLGSGK